MNSECNVGWFEIWSSIGFTEVSSVTVAGKMGACFLSYGQVLEFDNILRENWNI